MRMTRETIRQYITQSKHQIKRLVAAHRYYLTLPSRSTFITGFELASSETKPAISSVVARFISFGIASLHVNNLQCDQTATRLQQRGTGRANAIQYRLVN